MARILVIEDNPDNLELMSYLLDAYGHRVLIADDGERGIMTARSEHPDLIVCDIHLPGTDGYAIARALKNDALTREVPIVAVTALAMVGDREKVMAAGFDGYITKPIDPELFVGQIDRLLRADKRGLAPRGGHGNSVAETAPPYGQQASLVVVDDSPTNRELIYQTLVPFGYEVRLADNVQTALEMLRSLPPDLILSDLHMPGEDGFNLIRSIKEDARLASIPFIFISSSVWGEHDRETAMALGVHRFLLRPIEPQALIDEITNCLTAHSRPSDGEDPRR